MSRNKVELSGGVMTVTGTAPVASSGGATPAISMPAATNAAAGHATAAHIAAIEANTAKVSYPGAPDHNDLGSIQGGVATEYYHLTAAEYAALGGGGASEASWGSPPSAADYADAKTLGATTGVTFADGSNSDAIIIDTSKNELGATITAGTNRAQGILRVCPAGDFVYGVRVSAAMFDTSGNPSLGSATASLLIWGSVFVDGGSAANNDWYGMHKRLATRIYDCSYYKYTNIGAASPQFDIYTVGTSIVSGSYPNLNVVLDYWIQRIGTDLYIGSSLPGGTVVWDHKATGVSALAGLVGVRSETLIAETKHLRLRVLKDYLGSTLFPE